jgi:hypothetical protein
MQGPIGFTGDPRQFDALRHGCGVTGFDRDDCIRRANELFGDTPAPDVVEVIIDVDVSSLPAAVRDRVDDPSALGVWFP